MVFNVFCKTGPGGGSDPSCKASDEGGGGGGAAAPKKQAGFDLVPGVKGVKKNPDPMFGGFHVTLDNGDVHHVYHDKQSGVYRHANAKGPGYYDDIVATTKGEMLPNLVARAHKFNATK